MDGGRRARRGHTWRKLGDVNIDECARPGPRLTSTDAAATFPSGVSAPSTFRRPSPTRRVVSARPHTRVVPSLYMQHSSTVVAESYYLEYTYIQYNIYARRKKERKKETAVRRCRVRETANERTDDAAERRRDAQRRR